MDNSRIQELKAELSKDLYSETFKNFMELFTLILQREREKNDVASSDEVKKLQGSILLLKELLGIPNSAIKISHHDGGFN